MQANFLPPPQLLWRPLAAAVKDVDSQIEEAAKSIIADATGEDVRFVSLAPRPTSSSPRDRLAEWKRRAREKDGWGKLPLHRAAAKNGTDVAEIVKLLDAYPDGAKQKDDKGWLPLHYAAHKTPNFSVISKLLQAHPEGAKEKNGDGQLPLFLVFLSDKMVVSALLEAHPDLGVIDKSRYLKFGEDFWDFILYSFSRMKFLSDVVLRKSVHPLHLCIRLSTELKQFSLKQRSKDVRLADDADNRASELEQLLCSCARTGSVMNDSDWPEMDDCLELAVNGKLKLFISEPACSSRIRWLWENSGYSALDIEKTGCFALFCFSLRWFFSNAILHERDYHPPPVVKFWMNRASYFAFPVGLLTLPPLVHPADHVSSISREVFLAYWLLDVCFSEVAEFSSLKKKNKSTFRQTFVKYTDDPWNVYDLVALTLAIAAAVTRFMVLSAFGGVSAVSSNQLFAWALAMMWGRLLNVLSVFSFIGPLLIMVFVMLFRDLRKFAVLVVLMEMPFVAALHFLENSNDEFATLSISGVSFFKVVIGQGPDIVSVTSSPSSPYLLAIGTFLLTVLLLNLLIAMFSKTFDTIFENSTQEYMLQRAQLTFVWRHAPRMPPPLALALAIRDWIMHMAAKHLWQNDRFAVVCAGWESGIHVTEPVDFCSPNFDRLHFCKVAFPSWPNDEELKELEQHPDVLSNASLPRCIQKFKECRSHEFYSFSGFLSESKNGNAGAHALQVLKQEDCFALFKSFMNARFIEHCEKKYETWCMQVVKDFNENAKFKSDANMDRIESHMTDNAATTLRSYVMIDAIQQQVKALSDTVSNLQAQNQRMELRNDQLYASMQLILRKIHAQ